MKTLLICPNQANGLPVLADSKPLATLPVLGEPFVCCWMRHLAAEKFTEVCIVTADPTELIAECTGDGSRWGLKVEFCHEVRDLQPAEARKRYRSASESDWAPEPRDVIEADHLPGLDDHKLFSSYKEWFRALPLWMGIVTQTKRIGRHEVSPGVWVGRRTKISPKARLIGPCWIGENVQIGKDVVIGPNSFLEDQVVVDSGCSVENSWVGPNTFLGALTEVKDSLAWGNLLINWKSGSHLLVPDAFLMTSLTEPRIKEEHPLKEPAPAASRNFLARPFETVISLAQKLQS